MKQRKYFLLVIMVIVSAFAKADSPITSTPIYQAYLENPYVSLALKKGVLNDTIAGYLLNDTVSIDKKAAVINALGWDFNGKNNATEFFKYIQKKYNFSKAFDLDGVSGDDVFCLGYLTIMDNYFETEKPIKILKIAKTKNPKSYTVNIILALVEAQKAMDTDWCAVWRLAASVKDNGNLVYDMDTNAVKIIFDYMELYESSCK